MVIAVLAIRMIASATTTGTQLLRANTGSSSIPIATKKMPDRTSRNGARSAVICCAYSLPPRISPARNAPRAYDTPIRWLTHAIPKQVVRVDRSRSSGLRAEAITCSRRGMTYCMRMNVIPSSSAARAMAPARLCATSTGEPPPIGRRIIIGTTLRSCMIRMPTVRRPGSVSTRPCCIRLFRTTAVLLSAMMHPRKIAVRSGHPKNAPATIAVTSVSTICRLPPPRTTFRKRRNDEVSNSSPRVNMRRRTPISASSRTGSLPEISPRPCGPSRTPDTRYPTTGGSRRRVRRKRTVQAMASRTTSRPIRSTAEVTTGAPV